MSNFFIVDAFSSKPFSGNPAGVVLLTEERSEDWMQKLAGEVNLSETAFLLKRGREYHLRWFTPEVEVDLCGHATLASAHVLWETGALKSGEEARFLTRSGLLTCVRNGDLIEMDFPSQPCIEINSTDLYPEVYPDFDLESELDSNKKIGSNFLTVALRIDERKVKFIGKAGSDILLEVETEDVLRDVNPDFALLRKIEIRGVILTSRPLGSNKSSKINSDSASSSKTLKSDYDFVSRFFAPRVGIDEDPVTGSAHCALSVYWSGKLGRAKLIGFQASKRGGFVRTHFLGGRVVIGGSAVIVIEGTIR